MTIETQHQQIFLTGATGAMGLEATKSLVAAGHRVVGTTRSDAGARTLTDLGATSVQLNLLDGPALRRAMGGSDVVAHFATSIPGGFRATRRRAWRPNDQLRGDGTAAVIAAAEATGIRRVIFESISLAYPDRGNDWIDESEPLQPVSPVMTSALEAEQQLSEFQNRGGEAVCLRFGRLYGAGRASAELISALRTRSMPIVGAGGNLVSSIHVADVGRAVTAALRVGPGVYNVVDDEPLTQADLLREAAAHLNAPEPRRIPLLIGQFLLGHVARVLTVSHRVSNRKFRQSSGWSPYLVSARHGWRSIVADVNAGREAPAA